MDPSAAGPGPSRRDFLDTLLRASAGAVALPGALAACDRQVPPSDRVRIAVIGLRGWGRALIRSFSEVPGCEIATVCDVDTAVRDALIWPIRALTRRWVAFERDLRRVFDDPDIDAVAIATPHHWHALAGVWALQAGKHVYLEKPVTHDLREGAVLRAAVARYGGIVQCGTHRRSNTSLAAAADFLRSGGLGEVRLAKCLAYVRRPSIGPRAAHEPPPTVDYDLWTGPARLLPLERENLHYDWHWSWEYGNGGLGNNGVHRVDLARWGLGLEGLGDTVFSYGGRFGYQDAGETPNTQIVTHEFGDVTVIQELRGLATGSYLGSRNGVIFFGSEGRLVMQNGAATLYDPEGGVVRVFERIPEEESHAANFIRAIRAGDAGVLSGGLGEGIRSAGLCHVGSVGHRVGRRVSDDELRTALERTPKPDEAVLTLERTRAHLRGEGVRDRFALSPLLTLDSERERVANHPEADALLGRTYREPFVLPTEAGV